MKEWTDERIGKCIMAIASEFDPIRMPTNSEVIEMSGSYALSNAIQKNGGYEYWANKLGLEQKYSESKLGVEYEHLIAEILKARGHEAVMTPTKYPYDLLVDGCIKVDVKVANESIVKGSSVHAYRLSKKLHTCDFYVCCENDGDKGIYVIPAHVCSGQTQIEMGSETKYEKYHNAFNLIDRAARFYRENLI